MRKEEYAFCIGLRLALNKAEFLQAAGDSFKPSLVFA